MAIFSAMAVSPPSTPSTAAPRIRSVSASTTAFMKPRVSSISMARATRSIGSFATRTSRPSSRACSSVRPTRPSSGSV